MVGAMKQSAHWGITEPREGCARISWCPPFAQYHSVFHSSAADVCARFPAKDLNSGERSTTGREIAQAMDSVLRARGFIIEFALMKSIQLPAGVTDRTWEAE